MRFLLSVLLLVTVTFSQAEIVTVPIPGAPGLSVTVGTGVNALPLQNIQNNPNAVNITTADDGYTEVPLGFNFPMFGKTFSNSWAMTNGMVTFQDPAVSGIGGACCQGVNLATTTDPAWNYSIFGLHTDLYSWNGQNQYYLRGTNEMTYGWYNLSQCCSSQGGNSFEIKINSSGLIDTRIAGALVQYNAVTSGFSGDLTKGEYFQYYHGAGINIPYGAGVSWQALNGTGADLCLSDPLSSPSCPNYATAYLNQQCTISALYNPSCPGYAAAYYTQQCTLNPLYDVNCPGYASAYLEYQCSVNPLYSTSCSGYEQAYFTQQCEKNGLYDTKCPNYATAYATWLALNTSSPTTTTTATTTTQTSQLVSAPTVETTGEVKVAIVSDPTVNTVITSTATSASPAQTATATVPLVAPAPAPAPTTQTVEKKPEPSTGTAAPQQAQQDQGGKEQPKTARQEMQAKREAAAKAKAVEDGKNLAANMGKAVDMEQQKMVQNVVIAAMGYTPGFDTYSKVSIPQTEGYKPFTVYNNQVTVDNKWLNRGLTGASDSLHKQMVDAQYKE